MGSGRDLGEVRRGSPGRVSQIELCVLLILGTGRVVFAETTLPLPPSFPSLPTGRGSSEGGREEGALEDLSPAQRLSQTPP